jgi:hypothetical protein
VITKTAIDKAVENAKKQTKKPQPKKPRPGYGTIERELGLCPNE